MIPIRLGVMLYSQGTDWPTFLDGAIRAERLGYQHVWTWDHLYAIRGVPYQPILEGYTALAGLAAATERVQLGLFVGANPFRNPGLVAKSVATIDHISGGRAIAGLGAAWFGKEHDAFGIEFGASPGERIGWLAEAVPAVRTLLDGGVVTSPPGGRYAFRDLRIAPLPIQRHVPIMVGGGGVRKTLPIVAAHADMWNTYGSVEMLAEKNGILRDLCAAIGRDESTIDRSIACTILIRDSQAEAERALDEQLRMCGVSLATSNPDQHWPGTPERVGEIMTAYREVGFGTFVNELPYPYDAESMERLPEVAASLG